MNEEIKVTRCPMCGGLNLQANYDSASDVASTREFWQGGLWGVLKGAIKGKGSDGKYWLCLKCGHTFPMN